jgi:hypothetical protein
MQKIVRNQLVKSSVAGGSNKGTNSAATMFVNNNNVIPIIMRR